MRCGQDPVFVNQGPATEMLARGALNGHDVSDGVRRGDVSTHDSALNHILTCETNQQTRESTDSIFNLGEVCLDFPVTRAHVDAALTVNLCFGWRECNLRLLNLLYSKSIPNNAA